MDPVLLERDDTLAALLGAVEDAAAGRGSVVLVSGGAGLGKTSVVRAFAREATGRARVLLTSCDDLIAPRTLGPLRAAGVPAGRGPRATTRANPAGLTERQLDVLELLSEGLTNAQIAERLVLSVRTVDHHVAAVLEKLGVPSRHDAAGAARRLGVGAGGAHAAGPAAATRR